MGRLVRPPRRTRARRGLRIVYVASDAGDEDLVADVEALRERGHEAQLVAAGAPGLEELDAIKVATDWRAAEIVWERSVRHGVPVYLVRDVDAARRRSRIGGRMVAGLRPEFSYIAASGSIAEQLRLVATRVVVVEPGRLDDLEQVYLELAADSASGVREPVRRDVLGDVGGGTLP